MRFSAKKRRQAPAVIIVSLIDVLIVVLIFLVSSTQFKNPTAIKLALPSSTTSRTPGDDEAKPMIVEIAKTPPHLFLDGIPVGTNLLYRKIQEALYKNPDAVVALRADAMAPWGVIVETMDTAKSAGLKNLSAFTKPAEP
ncbi:MAG: ExbD/TolR family protein [Verrucomicrobiia bacterium]|jgi:biopolymer transport protein ExbD